MFYKRNLFLAELSNSMDLDTAKNWLEAIGDGNVGSLRRLAVCGWTMIAFGHQKSRLWIRAAFNLKDGTLEIEGNEATVDEHRHIFKDMGRMRDAYRAMVEAREGVNFDVYSLGQMLERFHALCAEYCTEDVPAHGTNVSRKQHPLTVHREFATL